MQDLAEGAAAQAAAAVLLPIHEPQAAGGRLHLIGPVRSISCGSNRRERPQSQTPMGLVASPLVRVRALPLPWGRRAHATASQRGSYESGGATRECRANSTQAVAALSTPIQFDSEGPALPGLLLSEVTITTGTRD